MRQNPVDTHLKRFAIPQRKILQELRSAIASALPAAKLVIKHGIPTFVVGGVPVLGFEGYQHHNSLFPYGGLPAALRAEHLANYTCTKGSIHFPLDQPFPRPLLKRLLKHKIQQINASFPNHKGEFLQFYESGTVKAQGQYRAGQLHGAWIWNRKNGSRLRCGSFAAGKQVGVWITYDRIGHPYKQTDFGA